MLFSNNGILHTQSVSQGPVGNVFVAGDKINHDLLLDLSLHCLSRICPYSTSAIREDKHTVRLLQKREVTAVWQTIDQCSGTFGTLLLSFECTTHLNGFCLFLNLMRH